jgi:hypothetical protein
MESMHETMTADPLDDIFADIMAHEFAPAANPLDAAPVGFEMAADLTPEEIDAAVAQFAGELNHDGDLTDHRFTAEDNKFLEENGITSRHMTQEELAAVNAREQRMREAHKVALMADFVVRDILGDFKINEDKDSKKKRSAFSLAA